VIRKLVLVGIESRRAVRSVGSTRSCTTEPNLTDAGSPRTSALVRTIANGVISVLATFSDLPAGKVNRSRCCWWTDRHNQRAAPDRVFSLVLPHGVGRAFVVLALTVTFLAFQQGATSPVTWLMLAEIFPLKLRGFAWASRA